MVASAAVIIDYQNIHLTGHDRFTPLGLPKHESLIHPLRFGVKGQNVCLARRVAGVRFGLFECRLSGCSRCR